MLQYLWLKVLKKMRGKAIIDCQIHDTAKVESGSYVIGSSIDRYSFCGYDCSLINCNIGAFCSIASRVSIGGASHPLHWVSTSPAFYRGRDSISKRLARLDYCGFDPVKKTIIENDVWIGEGVFIKAGIKIRNGAVIGMGAVVTKDVGAYEIWAGNPARLIRTRFDSDTISRLLKSKWWTWKEKKIKNYALYFNSPNIFLTKIEDKVGTEVE